MRKEVLVVLFPKYGDWAIALLVTGLQWGFEMWKSDYEIKTVGLTNHPVDSIGGFRTLPDYTFSNAPKDAAAIILVGSDSWMSPDAKAILPLVQEAYGKKILIGAICDATIFLGSHGFLNEIPHTSNSLRLLKEGAGESYQGETCYDSSRLSVKTDQIITASGRGYIEFARDIFLALQVTSLQEVQQWYEEYKKPIPRV